MQSVVTTSLSMYESWFEVSDVAVATQEDSGEREGTHQGHEDHACHEAHIEKGKRPAQDLDLFILALALDSNSALDKRCRMRMRESAADSVCEHGGWMKPGKRRLY
jgi:hypothetical protein